MDNGDFWMHAQCTDGDPGSNIITTYNARNKLKCRPYALNWKPFHSHPHFIVVFIFVSFIVCTIVGE